MDTTTRFLLFGKIVTAGSGAITAQWRSNSPKDFSTIEEAESFIHEEMNKEANVLQQCEKQFPTKRHETLSSMFEDLLRITEEGRLEMDSEREKNYKLYISEIEKLIKSIKASDRIFNLWRKHTLSIFDYTRFLTDDECKQFTKLAQEARTSNPSPTDSKEKGK